VVPDKTVTWQFEELLAQLREQKPNDRSDRDRYWAIVITEVEKAKAVFVQYAERKN
jgi:hypothetical protein